MKRLLWRLFEHQADRLSQTFRRRLELKDDVRIVADTLDGAGGQNRTGYARLFRAALYQ